MAKLHLLGGYVLRPFVSADGPARSIEQTRRTGWQTVLLAHNTFRHTYRSWLDETGASIKVPQELRRHAAIYTTISVYGQAMPQSKREANGKVVTMVLKPLRASA